MGEEKGRRRSFKLKRTEDSRSALTPWADVEENWDALVRAELTRLHAEEDAEIARVRAEEDAEPKSMQKT